ncbi:hypothetical protein [Candidatus Epulonipiscium viviparus]|uniref:hypothetical protein n=1 Tax=Candidatus Epulonipiscium viviparus TaxID=420336 RepID=UPI002738090B|nr:hypothetical protein [Candidatus Epulopiscium viviparus]
MKKMFLIAVMCLTTTLSTLAATPSNRIISAETAKTISAAYVKTDISELSFSKVELNPNTLEIDIEFFAPIINTDISSLALYQFYRCTLDAQTGAVISSNMNLDGHAILTKKPITPVIPAITEDFIYTNNWDTAENDLNTDDTYSVSTYNPNLEALEDDDIWNLAEDGWDTAWEAFKTEWKSDWEAFKISWENLKNEWTIFFDNLEW